MAFAGANRGVVIGVAAAVMTAILGGFFYARSLPVQTPPLAAPSAAAPAPTDTPALAQPAPETAAPAIPAPQLSVVRVTEDGGALVSGRGLAGAAITLRVDGAGVAEAATDAAGEFVAMFDLGYSAEAQILTLEMVTASGEVVRGGDSVILVPRPAPVVAAVAVPAEAPLAAPAPEVTLEAPMAEPPQIAAEAIDNATEPASTPAPQNFILREGGEVVVLGAAPQVLQSVVVDAITYDAAGDLVISGRARADQGAGRVQLYLDNRPVALAATANGGWAADLPQVDPGVYALRVDEIDETGRVISRFETPFQREAPTVVAAAQARADPAQADTPRVALITVQPGHTLWHISAAHYGEGIRYVQVFNANRGQIRNPDLIFPGQVFILPED